MKPTQELIALRQLRKTAESGAVTLERSTSRRYGPPWIASIKTWEIGAHPVLVFGYTHKSAAEIAAKPGDIIKYGQKDNKRPFQSENEFGIVTTDYKIERITMEQARTLYREY